MSKGSKIAAKVAKGIAKAGAAVGDGPLICTIKRPATGPTEPQTPWDDTVAGDPTYHEVTAIQGSLRIRDASGTLIGETKRTLTIDTTGVEPLKSDLIAVGVAKADVDANTRYEGISEVTPLAPGGEALMYEVVLEN